MYTYLEDEALADIGIHVETSTLDDLFIDAGYSVCRLMTDTADLSAEEERQIELSSSDLELLLHSFLEEFVYYKDAELFVVKNISCIVDESSCSLTAVLRGTYFDRLVHTIGNDVKAITLHDFYIHHTSGWEAHFIVDI